MANGQQRKQADPPKGRLVVIAAAVVGAGAILGYGFAHMQARKEAKTQAANEGTERPATKAPPPASTPAVVTRAQAARRSLDTAALQRLEGELGAAAATVPDARGEQVAVLTALAVESSVRGTLGADPQATQQAAALATRARTLLERHSAELDPGLRLAARARVALASGEDPLAAHPAVLLPGFPDRELQHLLLAEPLWRPGAEPLPNDTRADLVRRLEQLPEPTAVERLLLALALPVSTPRAQALVSDVLTASPAQPLAQAIGDHLRTGSRVAVADPLPTEPAPTEPAPSEAAPTEAEPTEAAPTEPEPTEPEPTEPEPSEPEPSKPKATPDGSEPAKKNPPKPKAPKPPTDLADEGCKLVQSGKAEQGFAMLQKAFDQDPRDTKVILCMAEGHMKLGRLPSARAMVERVLRSNGKSKKALNLAAKIEDKLGNERSAADYYRKLLELDPDDATAKAYVEKHGG